MATASFALLLLFLRGDRGKIRPSTSKLLRQSGFRPAALHGYVYLRWIRPYIRTLLRLPDPQKSQVAARAARWLAERYHGKVRTHEHTREIILLNRDIPPHDLEQIVPYAVARNIVLHGPPEVVTYECVCRHVRHVPCEPTQVCMVIGKPSTDFTLEHHPNDSRRLPQAEALEPGYRRSVSHPVSVMMVCRLDCSSSAGPGTKACYSGWPSGNRSHMGDAPG